MRILFVCMGNICRSPTAEGVFRRVVAEAGESHWIEIDSAGTHDYHVGEPPDRRAQAAARRRGVDLSGLRARQLDADDFERFDLLLVMDERNHADALEIAGARRGLPVERLRLFLDYAPGADTREVPDPYYGGAEGFERVLDLVEEASHGLLAALRSSRAGRS